MLHREDCAWKYEDSCCCGLFELEAENRQLRRIIEVNAPDVDVDYNLDALKESERWIYKNCSSTE